MARARRRSVTAIDGFAYGKFIVPGLFTQAVVTIGFINGTTTIFEARLHRYVHDVFASPLRWWEINAAVVAGGMVRGAIIGCSASRHNGPSRPLVRGRGPRP